MGLLQMVTTWAVPADRYRYPDLIMTHEEWFIDQFRDTLCEPLSAADGLDVNSIDELLCGRPIPNSMRAYYKVAGKHWLNSNHNELLALDAHQQLDGHSIFMNENQMVVRWAIRNSDLTPDDPTVFQMQPDLQTILWQPENYTFRTFMIAVWKWTLTGEDPNQID